MRRFLILWSLAAIACGSNDEKSPSAASPSDGSDSAVDSGGTGTTSPTGPTWYNGVGHVVIEHCGSCHRSGGLASGLSFEDPELASTLSVAIAAATASGTMPPFMAQESEVCANPWGWEHDPRLSPDEIALLAEWDAAGAPIGEPDPDNPLPPLPSNALPGAEPPVFPNGSFTTDPIGEIQDDFICFTIDPNLDEPGWLDGLEVVPGNDTIVHHVLVGLDQTGESAALADENGVYPCFGGFGALSDVTFMGAWVPGSAPITFPEHSALGVDPDARFVLQMHYHRDQDPQTDATGLALRFTDTLPIRSITMGLVGNFGAQFETGDGLQPGPDDPSTGPAFLIPAGATDHVETMRTPVFEHTSRAQEVFLVTNHMHYIGTDMRVWLEHGEDAPADADAETCLLHTPEWDFDWQQFFQFDASGGSRPLIHPNDKIWMECRYNNSLENDRVVKALAESGLSEPIDVGLGEGSLDEMCLAVLGTVPQVPLKVDGETHTGQFEISVSSELFSFTAPCEGPLSVRVNGDAFEAVGACGLGVLDYLYTVEVVAEGTVTSAGVDGSVSFTVLDVEGSAVGTVDGATDAAHLSASGTWGGGDIAIDGIWNLTAR